MKYKTKETIKAWITIMSSIIAAAIPFVIAFLFWSWCMDQINPVSEWAGIIKVAITIALVIFGGGTVIVSAIGFGAIIASFMIYMFKL